MSQSPLPMPPSQRRIPADLPFVARHRLGKRMRAALPLIVVLSIVGLCGGGTVVANAIDVRRALSGVVLALVWMAVSVVLPLLLFWVVFGRGPVLAIGHDGLWISSRPWRGGAIWLPWAAIPRIERRNRFWHRMLLVTALDQASAGNLDGIDASDRQRLDAVWGRTFTATITFSDRTEEQVFTALHYYSAGQCDIRQPPR